MSDQEHFISVAASKDGEILIAGTEHPLKLLVHLIGQLLADPDFSEPGHNTIQAIHRPTGQKIVVKLLDSAPLEEAPPPASTKHFAHPIGHNGPPPANRPAPPPPPPPISKREEQNREWGRQL